MTKLDWLLAQQENSNAYCYLAVADYQHLHRLLGAWPDKEHPVRRGLAAKLRRGIPCGPEPLHDVVTVGAQVDYRRERGGPLERAVLVYPDDLPTASGGVSVTSEFGALLLGMRQGQVVHQPSPDGKLFYLFVERVKKPVRQQREVAQAAE